MEESNTDSFINYRMNDHHGTTDPGYATHSAFWLENKDEYGVSMENGNVLNYIELYTLKRLAFHFILPQ